MISYFQSTGFGKELGQILDFTQVIFLTLDEFICYNKITTKKKGGKHLIEKETKIITHGEVDAKNLGEEEQRAFYISLLARILELYRKEKGKEVN